MIQNITQVTRTYRTHELWYAEDEDWKRRERNHLRLSSRSPSSRAAANLVQRHYAFDEFVQAAVQALADVLAGAYHLQEAGRDVFTESGDSVFDSRAVISSHSEAATGIAATGAATKTYTLQIERIAESQVNQGSDLQAAAPTVISAGSNQMSIAMDGVSIPISVYVLHTDTNEQALQKLHGAIRDRALNIEAALVAGSGRGTMRLQLKSSATGAAQSFTVSDIFGNAASETGMNNVTQQAQDAVYRIDAGALVSSGSNEVTLVEGALSITLKNSSSQPIQLSVVPDTTSVERQVQALVDSYNALLMAVYHSSPLLKASVEQAIATPLSSLPLAELGIIRDAYGILRLNADALKQQAGTDYARLESSLRGPTGVADVLTRTADSLLAQPSSQLLDWRQSLFQTFTNYRCQSGDAGSLRTYLPVPLAGNLLNSYL
jgi:flagellar capping protein FliD